MRKTENFHSVTIRH